MERPMESGWKAYGKWMEGLCKVDGKPMESGWKRQWKVDGNAYEKWMERPMESGWKGLWKVDGKAYGRWMES